MTKNIKTVDVGFRSVLQARLLANDLPLASYLDEWFQSVISSSKSKLLKKLIGGFDNLLNSSQLENIIQFKITPLDKNLILFFLANIEKLDNLINEKDDYHIKIYSENSFSDAGFIFLSSKFFEYVNTPPIKKNLENILFEYDPGYKSNFLNGLSGLKNYESNVRVVTDGEPSLLLTSDFDLKTQPYYYKTFFIDPHIERKIPFNGFSFNNISSEKLSLIPNSAEAVLQLSAAFENDYWLLFSTGYGGKFYIFKVPELSDSSAIHNLWGSHLLEPSRFINYENSIGYRNLDKASLDINLAISCSKEFNWFLPKDSEIIPHYINLLN